MVSADLTFAALMGGVILVGSLLYLLTLFHVIHPERWWRWER